MNSFAYYHKPHGYAEKLTAVLTAHAILSEL